MEGTCGWKGLSGTESWGIENRRKEKERLSKTKNV